MGIPRVYPQQGWVPGAFWRCREEQEGQGQVQGWWRASLQPQLCFALHPSLGNEPAAVLEIPAPLPTARAMESPPAGANNAHGNAGHPVSPCTCQGLVLCLPDFTLNPNIRWHHPTCPSQLRRSPGPGAGWCENVKM